RLYGPAAGKAFRPGDSGCVAGTRDGPASQRRCMHRKSELRLYPHTLLAQRETAATDGVESARCIREAFRRYRQNGAECARSSFTATEEHSRFGDGKAGRAEKAAWTAGQLESR